MKRLSILLLLLGPGCSSPLGGQDLELGAGPSVLPGYGFVVSGAQRMWSSETKRLDLELDWTHQEIDPTVMASTGKFDQVRFATRLIFKPDAPSRWSGRFGATWLRARGDPVFMTQEGDYAGGFFGVGYEWQWTPHITTGPDFTLSYVTPEKEGTAGFVPQFAWRFVWRL